jgi:hypothetical protein
MRIAIDLPDSLCRELRAKAAAEGLPLNALLSRLVELGLSASQPVNHNAARSVLPSISTGRPLGVAELSNAGLFDLLGGNR